MGAVTSFAVATASLVVSETSALMPSYLVAAVDIVR